MVDRDMKNASAFGLSKELNVPVAVKLCYLQATEVQQEVKMLAKPSEKYSNPQIFRKLSHIYFNSDLIVKIELFDGSNNLMTVPTQTMHHLFTNNKRMWNIYLRMAINYNQLSVNSYLKFTLYEIVNSEYVEFGTGRLGIFKDETLRMGLQKVGIVRVPNDGVSGGKLGQFNEETGPLDVNNDNSNEDCACGETETKLFQYQDGKMPKVPWLDTLSLPLVEKKRDTELKGCPFFLYIELPKFQLPIVYSDVTFQLPDTAKITQEFIENRNSITDPNINLVINKVETDTPGVYDPDFHLSNLDLIGGSVNYLDPIESKFHKLERNMNNSTLLDKELKPTPQLRDELLKILERPSNIELSDVEKNLIWKFRYYFSKNNTAAGGGISAAPTSQAGDPNSESFKINQKFLTKFLKSINWDNDYELNHTFNEIIPYYWSVDKIQIGDALELLSSYFNPLTLVKHASVQQESTDDQKESRIDMIFRYVRQLRNFAVNRLRKASGDELLLYLLQLVQALKYEALIVDTEINTVTDLDGGMDDIISTRNNDDKGTDSNDSKLLEKSPLALFLIEKSVENEKLGNFFYWFVKVENEDQINTGSNSKIYSIILNKYIEEVKRYSSKNKLPNYNYLKRQVWFIKKLTGLVELLRNTFKKNEATTKKIQFLREYLADSSNEFLKFPHSFPLPLDPSVMICGCYPEESSVFKSSLQPLKLTFKTVIKDSNQIFGDRRKKYGKYTMMFKIGDDLRQDQLVIQIINLMDQLLKNENLDLKLTPYRILATSPIAGMIQFVPNETLDSILAKNYGDTIGSTATTTTTTAINNNTNNGILNYLILHSQESQPIEPVEASVLGSISSEMTNSNTSNNTNLNTNKNVDQKHTVTSDLGVSPILMDNYVKSCAGYCVITYLLGVGDRHLDNLLLSPNGKFWHADFGYILGRDPKPFPPLMKLPIQVIDGMGGLNHENFSIFKNYCFVTYTTLRKNSNLILNLFQLMLDANIPDIKMDPTRAVEKVQEKFCLEMTEEEAILHFQNLINDSVNAFLPVVIDRLHSLAQYWRA